MITFEQARQTVRGDWPDYDPSPVGFEGEADWFVILSPLTVGGRIAAVSKTSGDIRWINENADEYNEQRPVFASVTRTQVDDDDARLRGITRAAGHDVTPGHDELHHFWTRDPKGRAQWVDSPKPWTTLVGLLTEHVGPERAKVFASRWFHEVFGFYAGSDMNRVTHGHPPRGHRIGPG